MILNLKNNNRFLKKRKSKSVSFGAKSVIFENYVFYSYCLEMCLLLLNTDI